MTDEGSASDSPTLQIAPDAVIRFISGCMFVHTGSGPRSYPSTDTTMAALLASFATPNTVSAVIDAFPSGRQLQYRAAIEQLRRIGALVTPTAQRTQTPTEGPPVNAQLALVADAVQRIGGSLAAMGPHAELQLVPDGGGVSLQQRLTALVAGVTALEAELTAMRPAFMASQLQSLGIAEAQQGLKLHLGSGATRLPGWVNIDAHPAELSMDLRWGLPFNAGSADYVFMSHVFEHFYYPDESSAVLQEIHRVLTPGGRVRLIVPDIELCIQAYCNKDTAFVTNRQRTWTWWPRTATRLEDFLAYAGAGPRASHFLEGHKFGYDFETLAHALKQAGFSKVARSSYMGSDDPVLQVDTASSVAAAQSEGQFYSLFVEAWK